MGVTECYNRLVSDFLISTNVSGDHNQTPDPFHNFSQTF